MRPQNLNLIGTSGDFIVVNPQTTHEPVPDSLPPLCTHSPKGSLLNFGYKDY